MTSSTQLCISQRKQERQLGSIATNLPSRTSQETTSSLVRWSGVALVSGLTFALYATPLQGLVSDWWNDPGASYGFLVPPFALYLAWLRRSRTLSIPAAEDGRGLVLVFAGCLMCLLGKLGAEFFITRISLLFVLAGITCTFWGAARTRTLAFPFLLLSTMVPLPTLVYNRVAIPLQLFASQAAADTLQLFGQSVYRDGNILQLPGTTLGVAEACSGLHSLAALFVVAMVVGMTACRSRWARGALVVLSIPVAIGVNALRVTITAFLANINVEYAMGFYHGFAGWLIFVAGFGILMLLAKGLHRVFDSRLAENGAA